MIRFSFIRERERQREKEKEREKKRESEREKEREKERKRKKEREGKKQKERECVAATNIFKTFCLFFTKYSKIFSRCLIEAFREKQHRNVFSLEKFKISYIFTSSPCERQKTMHLKFIHSCFFFITCGCATTKL